MERLRAAPPFPNAIPIVPISMPISELISPCGLSPRPDPIHRYRHIPR
jgi:hypothetical protein